MSKNEKVARKSDIILGSELSRICHICLSKMNRPNNLIVALWFHELYQEKIWY